MQITSLDICQCTISISISFFYRICEACHAKDDTWYGIKEVELQSKYTEFLWIRELVKRNRIITENTQLHRSDRMDGSNRRKWSCKLRSCDSKTSNTAISKISNLHFLIPSWSNSVCMFFCVIERCNKAKKLLALSISDTFARSYKVL